MQPLLGVLALPLQPSLEVERCVARELPVGGHGRHSTDPLMDGGGGMVVHVRSPDHKPRLIDMGRGGERGVAICSSGYSGLE
ncbi:unnamed protein product [Gadus morhua 'NCC']